MSRLLQYTYGLASLGIALIGTTACEGPSSVDLNGGGRTEEPDAVRQALKSFARKFKVTAREPLIIETRGGQTIRVRLADVEVELAESTSTATRARTPVVDTTIPADAARRVPTPATFQADVPCSGVATRAHVPVPDVSIGPEVPDSSVPSRVRVPAIEVTPAEEGMSVIATRVRIPAGQIEAPRQTDVPPGSGTAALAEHRSGKKVVVAIPAISVGLIDATDPRAAQTLFLAVPTRKADSATFVSIKVRK